MFEKNELKVVGLFLAVSAILGVILNLSHISQDTGNLKNPSFLLMNGKQTYQIALGSLVSLECFNPPGFFFRHTSFMLMA